MCGFLANGVQTLVGAQNHSSMGVRTLIFCIWREDHGYHIIMSDVKTMGII